MIEPAGPTPSLPAQVCQRALDARDARFDGLFFVGIVTTRIYCRPTCPSRRAMPDHRRFFNSAAAAESSGFRPCLRCRPELAPGKTAIDAVSRLASTAAYRIGAGALNGRSVADLAAELGVGERHLRRALRRELGVSPVELAQTHRLLLAKRLLAETTLSITDIAFASGFESLRRFNFVFHDRYGMSPSALRRPARREGRRAASDLLRMTLAYRPPLAWDVLAAFLDDEATPGVEIVEGRRYGRTVRLDGRTGVVFVEDSPAKAHLKVDLSPSLLPALMPLLARLRRLFDLDAQPAVVDAHLERGGLALQRRGVRLPGALDGFEIGLRALLGARDLAGRVAAALGEPVETGHPALDRLAPDAGRLAEAGSSRLVELGVPRRRAETLLAFARAAAEGALRLDPGGDVAETHRALLEITGIDERLATRIVMRALYWPDAFPLSDRALQEAAGAATPRALRARAEKWRPWRAYAALHLGLRHGVSPVRRS
jgi:AraC family transcriptional regulator, regulatory protein of adaptative response / DNA-3-methyladenine glycosylase II